MQFFSIISHCHESHILPKISSYGTHSYIQFKTQEEIENEKKIRKRYSAAQSQVCQSVFLLLPLLSPSCATKLVPYTHSITLSLDTNRVCGKVILTKMWHTTFTYILASARKRRQSKWYGQCVYECMSVWLYECSGVANKADREALFIPLRCYGNECEQSDWFEKSRRKCQCIGLLFTAREKTFFVIRFALRRRYHDHH